MFGVTLWEMFSRGEEPWAGVPPYLILQRLEKDRARLPRPPLCSRALYALARRCWAPNPADRPSFSCLEELLQEVRTPVSLAPLFSSLQSVSQGSAHKLTDHAGLCPSILGFVSGHTQQCPGLTLGSALSDYSW